MLTYSAPLLFAQDGQLPRGVTRQMIEQGKQIFKDRGNCWTCHGIDAAGSHGVGANLTDNDWWHNDGSYTAIVRQIETGVPAGKVRNKYKAAMPPRGGSKITDEEVKAVAAYVWSLSHRTGPKGG